jgi:hypothetical protein
MKRIRFSNAFAGSFLLAVLFVCSTVSAGPGGDIQVSGPFFDETTRGDWRDTYGSCFFLIPDTRDEMTRESVGPSWCGEDPRQYRYNNCYGGLLFDLEPGNSSVDWRIFRNEEQDVSISTWTTDLTIVDDSPQWNPCINDFRHATYATEGDSTDSLGLDLRLDVKGDITVAYYFTGAQSRCRETIFGLSVDGVEMASGRIEDFATGTYVVFDVEGLDLDADGTVISIMAEDAPGNPQCEISDTERSNVHVSGVFVSGMNNLQEHSCRSLVGKHRRRSSRGNSNKN